MNKAKKICKFQLKNSVKPIVTLYIASILIVIVQIVAKGFKKSEAQIGIMEVGSFTILFLFILGLNYFRNSFCLAKANNVSRKTYYKGIILSIVVISACLPVIDIILNRIINIFFYSPMIFDQLYGRFDPSNEINNTVGFLSKNYLFIALLYIVTFSFGFCISVVYYRIKRIGTVVFSIIIIGIVIALVWPITSYSVSSSEQFNEKGEMGSSTTEIDFLGIEPFTYTEGDTFYGMVNLVDDILGINSKSPFNIIFIMVILSGVQISIGYILIRKSEIDKKMIGAKVA